MTAVPLMAAMLPPRGSVFAEQPSCRQMRASMSLPCSACTRSLCPQHVQDNDGDWMLLGPEQPWPGKLDHVACRIVVSSA